MTWGLGPSWPHIDRDQADPRGLLRGDGLLGAAAGLLPVVRAESPPAQPARRLA